MTVAQNVGFGLEMKRVVKAEIAQRVREALGALDLKLRKAMQLELKHIQSEVGIAFIYVTHDQEEALTMSDRIAVMDWGVVQQVGKPREIYEHPANRFVADFIGETNFIEGAVTEVNEGHNPSDIRESFRLGENPAGFRKPTGLWETCGVAWEGCCLFAFDFCPDAVVEGGGFAYVLDEVAVGDGFGGTLVMGELM